MRPSSIRAQWPRGLLSITSNSKRCRIGPQKLWLTSSIHLNSTPYTQASTNSRDVNAVLRPTIRQGSQPAARPAASSLPNGTGAPTESTPKRRRKGLRRRCTITLDPARLNFSCFLDVSGIKYLRIYDSAAPESRSLLDMTYTSSRGGVQLVHDPFPPDTRGFLYFHADAHNPLQSQICFRVTRDHDAARSFSSGQDLTYGSGYTWHIPLVNAAKSPTLCEMLLRDGLIDDALHAQLQAHPPSATGSHRTMRLKRAMSVLDQPFILDFAKWTLFLVVHVAGRDLRYDTGGPLTYRTGKGKYLVYEAGSALCRLERSNLPQHAGRRVVVMRLLKIVRPPKLHPDLPPTCNVSIPEEGKLFKFGERVWYRDVDKPGKGAEILRLLYDVPNDGEPASGRPSWPAMQSAAS